MKEDTFRRGDLVMLKESDTLKRPNTKVVVLGSTNPRRFVDEIVPVGTVCMVNGRHVDPTIASENAYLVVLEHTGTIQQFWVYESEMSLVSRP